MTQKEFENMLKDEIVKAYIGTYGVANWNSLSNEEKDMVLHIVVNDLAKAVL